MDDPENNDSALRALKVEYDPFAPALNVEFETTPGQREMWISSHAGPGAGCAYNESFSVRLTGEIDDEALAAGLKALPELHEALKGRFARDGELFVIEQGTSIEPSPRDLSLLPAGERETALARIEAEAAETPYDLETGPLFRTAIVRMAEGERVVMLCAHHAACDGWSLDVLLSDLSRLYSAFARGGTPPAPPRHGFSDFADYVRSPDYAARVEASRAFWKEKFKTPPPPLELNTVEKRPALRTYQARHARLSLSRADLDSAKEFALARGISLFSTLLSAYAVLIGRASGESDFTVGIPVAGHPDAGMEDCVGHLVNLVPVRIDARPSLPFGAFCVETNGAILDARDNAVVGFGEIVSDIRLPRDPSRIPLVAASFTHVQKYAPEKIRFGNCAVEYWLNFRSFETFELNLNAVESQDGLEIRAHANARLFDQGWLERRLGELASILREGCRTPEIAIGEISLASKGEAAAPTIGAEAETAAGPMPAIVRAKLDLHAAQAKIHAIWAAQLNGEEFSDDSNLFDIGGNSFIAVRIALGLERELGAQMDLALILQHPTVESLSRYLAGEEADDEEGGSLVAKKARMRRAAMESDE